MRVIIPGGSGLIGKKLAASLAKDAHEVIILSRSPEKASPVPDGVQVVVWDGKTLQGWGLLVEKADAVVNLAGENISGEGFFPSRWTAKRKAHIRDSRLNTGQAVLAAMQAAGRKPEVLIQASAIGYYGPLGDVKVDEGNPPGRDFSAELCQQWEASTAAVEGLGVRRVVIRSGVVLTTEGGALPRLLLPFKLFAGGPFGSGRQYISWIHVADEIAAIRFLIENKAASGVYNLTSPNPRTNAEVGKAIAKAMTRPYYLPIPGFALKAAFGEVAQVVLDGQRVVPTRLSKLGYNFQFPELETAIQDVLSR